MKNKITQILTLSFFVIFSSFCLSGCGKKTTTQNTEPTPTPVRLLELKDEEKPYISLVPREDGHELKMKISKIPASISQIEYELIYTAVDKNLEMEKGVGDTIKVDSSNLERDLLLGTASCTNGCKYKYDEGVTGGTLSLTLISTNGQMSTLEVPFTFKSANDVKKDNNLISLKTDNFSTKLTPKTGEFYILLKNALVYSLFSSNSNKSLIGDYPIDK